MVRDNMGHTWTEILSRLYLSVHALYPSSTISQDGERLDDEDNFFLMRTLLKIGCEPGAIGAMSGGASPSDPIFWVIHPVLEKGMHVVMLAPDFRETYDYAWVNNTCYGSSVHDKLPFTGEIWQLLPSELFSGYPSQWLLRMCMMAILSFGVRGLRVGYRGWILVVLRAYFVALRRETGM